MVAAKIRRAAARPDPSLTGAAGDDIDALRTANTNLVESLSSADRTIAQLREQLAATPAPPGPRPEDRPAEADAGRSRRRGRGEPSPEDWERMAQVGTVRVRVPCMRDKPWTPSPRVIDRLGLAPQDAVMIREAYEHSNKRMSDQIRPLCAKALGSTEAADRVGPKACSEAILSGANGPTRRARRSRWFESRSSTPARPTRRRRQTPTRWSSSSWP